MPDSLRSWLWLAVLLLASAALAVARVVALPGRAAPAVAVVLGVTLVVGLTHRAGGRPLVPALVALAYGVACVATTSTVLLAGGAVGTAVAAAALAITATVPAVTLGRALLEVLVAAALATLGGLGAGGFGVRPDQSRFGYVVLGASLLMAFGLVYRLGAGFHGLGRRGYAIAAGALLLLALALAYSSAVGRWGSHDLVVHLHHLRALTRSHLHAVPHPIETLLGVPALCWGTFMRASSCRASQPTRAPWRRSTASCSGRCSAGCWCGSTRPSPRERPAGEPDGPRSRRHTGPSRGGSRRCAEASPAGHPAVAQD